MTHQEVLEKAIRKAAAFDISIPHFPHPLEEYKWNDEKRYWYLGDITIPLFEIIYQHSFAKDLWGEEEVDLSFDGQAIKTSGGDNIRCYKWQYYLQQMVISDDPIRYLGEHI